MKLTKAQRRELKFISKANCGCHYADRYGPIKALLTKGFVFRANAKYAGGMYSITPAGRAALEQEGR